MHSSLSHSSSQQHSLHRIVSRLSFPLPCFPHTLSSHILFLHSFATHMYSLVFRSLSLSHTHTLSLSLLSSLQLSFLSSFLPPSISSVSVCGVSSFSLFSALLSSCSFRSLFSHLPFSLSLSLCVSLSLSLSL